MVPQLPSLEPWSSEGGATQESRGRTSVLVCDIYRRCREELMNGRAGNTGAIHIRMGLSGEGTHGNT